MMYHRLLKKSSRDVYTITPDAFEADLKYFSENGYTAVTCAEVLNYLLIGSALPKKPVLLTFDDGHYSTLAYAAPLLEEYGMKASVFVVGAFSDKDEGRDNPVYSYITWEEMRNLPSCLEIQNHTWGLHEIGKGRKGIKRRSSESLENYRILFASDMIKLSNKVQECTGARPVAFAIPFGANCSDSIPVLDAVGIGLSLGSEYGVNRLKVGGKRHALKRLCRTPGMSAQFLVDKYAKK
jgi:peptidoglycan/xylan/chitin deacetylase (PgdA/CDA1 family)